MGFLNQLITGGPTLYIYFADLWGADGGSAINESDITIHLATTSHPIRVQWVMAQNESWVHNRNQQLCQHPTDFLDKHHLHVNT